MVRKNGNDHGLYVKWVICRIKFGQDDEQMSDLVGGRERKKVSDFHSIFRHFRRECQTKRQNSRKIGKSGPPIIKHHITYQRDLRCIDQQLNYKQVKHNFLVKRVILSMHPYVESCLFDCSVYTIQIPSALPATCAAVSAGTKISLKRDGPLLWISH